MLGIALACVPAFAIVPAGMGLYETRGSPPVSVDSASLSLVALIANLVVLVVILAAGRRATGRRDE